ncbi:MAG: glycosyltransferase family 2 protein [Proteobacteria bacterium]|nr:glycosyltransferase family 2 protein [Pseudomonadota bacterium]
MKISLIIPVYNEADHLEKFLKVIDSIQLPVEKELVFIDDCSRDGSTEILKNFKFQSSLQLLFQEYNQGKGAALARGIAQATGDIIGVQDADFEYDPNDIPKLVQPLIEGRADVVFGSRFNAGGTQVHRTLHYLVNRFLTLMSNVCSGLYLSDMETCYKFFHKDIIQNIKLEAGRFGFEPEVTAKIARLKLRVHEFPISYFPRNYIEGKKITWKDGIAALRHIIYFNYFSTNEDCFKNELPQHYIPKGSNWL